MLRNLTLVEKKIFSDTNLDKPETDSRPCQTSKPDLFTKIVNGFRSLTVFVQIFILDI